MSQQISLIPESAPFDEEQRAWLNGFFAGWLGLQQANGEAPPPFSGENATALIEPAEDEDFPWHDPALPLDDRLQLADGKPFPRRLMAAMAQLDCGSCGYDCQRYAEAIASGEESSLKLCSPGGKETARKLKELVTLETGSGTNGHATNGKSNGTLNGSGNGHTPPSAKPSQVSLPEWSRKHPFPAKVISVRNLNGAGSSKQTSHVEIDLRGSGLTYDVGDSLGVYPTNCGELVQEIIAAVGADRGAEVTAPDGSRCTLERALSEYCCLSEITDELLELLAEHSGNAEQAARLRAAIDDPDLLDSFDLLDLLRSIDPTPVAPGDFVAALSAITPRLYSISSSLKAHPDQVHLTVGRVCWETGGRLRKGVASTMFADRLSPGDTVRVYVQKSHGFTVPADPTAPMIMIGPGTGIAPFRAFLQERQAQAATGPNWLFFGDQKSACDFLYREELEGFQRSGILQRLDTAFSRDQEQKIYVQDRMREAAFELFQWLEQGAHVYVCGDAKRMAVDVDRALHEIVATRVGGAEAADDYINNLRKTNRYCRDVY